MDGKGKWAAPFAACAVLIALMASAYIGGYFLLSKPVDAADSAGNRSVIRFYRYKIISDIYKPAAEVESLIVGYDVIAFEHD
jgi:hypothetical protein